jgi:cellulose synthase/poly-beta-1,6-N-acetylglucosamine synthase-like glycosyltransferase
MEDVLFWMFATSSSVYVLHIGFYLIGANFYDIWQYQRLHRHRELLEYQQFKHRPLVTVLVPAHNEEKVVERCLDSIRKNTYKNIQVIAVDDGSADMTLRVLRGYKRRHPEFDLAVTSTSKNVGKGGALNYALRRFAKGKLVMTLDADSMISSKAIERAVSYFADPTVAGVAANVRVIDDGSILAMLQKLEHMIGYRSKKTYSLLNCEFVIGGVASTYRMDAIKRVGFYDTDTLTEDIGLSMKVARLGNLKHRLIYGADVEAITEGVSSYAALIKQRFRWKYGCLQNLVKHRQLIGRPRSGFTPSLTLYRLPTAILSELLLIATPFIWTYIAYISIAGHNPYLVFGAYCTITLYTLVTLWFDEHTTLRKRVGLSIHAMYAYAIFYVMDIVQFIGVSRCIYRIKSLLKQKNIGSAWTSPARAGQEITAD